MPRPFEAVLAAISVTVLKARDALDADAATLSSHLVVISDFVGEAMAVVVRSGLTSARQAEVAQKLVTIMEAVRDALRAVKAGERERVDDALGIISTAVAGALDAFTRPTPAT